MRLPAFILVIMFAAAATFAQGEAAPIIERDFEYRTWTFPSVVDDTPRELRSLIAGKKLVIVAYFAPWCPNWKHDAPFIKRLHDKYGSRGLAIIGVGEYASVDAMRASLDTFKLTIPVVYESTARADVNKTTHYETRRKTGDTRGWGSPWYVFIEPDKVEKKGDILMKRASVINGEMIESEVEAFIEKRLEINDGKRAASERAIDKCDAASVEQKGL